MKYDDATRSVVGVGSAARNDASSGGLSFKISVVVPTFNRCESLRGLLESIRRQTLSSTQFQVIVVSDGSSDGTVEMVLDGRLVHCGNTANIKSSCPSLPINSVQPPQ